MNRYKRWRQENPEKVAKYEKARRARYKEEGKCRCGAPLHDEADAGRACCINCRQHIHKTRMLGGMYV